MAQMNTVEHTIGQAEMKLVNKSRNADQRKYTTETVDER